MKKKLSKSRNNIDFLDSELMNTETYFNYLDRFKKVALSIFEWVNLPKSMNARFMELALYYDGKAAIFKDENYGFINTRCTDNGYINIYGLPTRLHCYSYELHRDKLLYTGFSDDIEKLQGTNAILVQNNWDRVPTEPTLALFAQRLAIAERASDTNVEAQRTPVMILVGENQRLTMENLYGQYRGNRPFIFGDKQQMQDMDSIKAINTQAPVVFDKLQNYKKEIWNEALTYLGINNVMIEKAERLITDEANSNNELINLNLQASLAPRKEACKQFNELFGLTGTDKEIDVRVRSDLHNIIKNAQSIVSDYKEMENIEEIDVGGEIDG